MGLGPEPVPEEPGPGLEETRADTDGLLDLLSSPLDDNGELNTVLTRRPRVKIPSVTLILAVIAVASAGFLGGALVGKHYGSSGSGNLAAAFRGLAARATSSASPGASGGTSSGFPGGGGGTFGGNATIGTIKLVDGSIVYVETTSGDVVQVATSSGTKVTASETIPVKSLTPGETVIVEGSKNSSGAIAATSISQTTLGAGGFGG